MLGVAYLGYSMEHQCYLLGGHDCLSSDSLLLVTLRGNVTVNFA
jgi:hypothetical protein